MCTDLLAELALSVLANLIKGDSETKMNVLVGSRMGKLMCDKLDAFKTPGVVQQVWDRRGQVEQGKQA